MKTLIPLVLIAVILFATNPGKETHVKRLQEHVEEAGAKEGNILGSIFGGAIVGALGGALERENYYLFSTLKSDDETLTFGIAGQVFVVMDEDS